MSKFTGDSVRDQFLHQAQQRLAPLSGEAYTREVEKIQAEMGALIHAEAEKQFRAQIASLEGDLRRVLTDNAANTILGEIAKDDVCSRLLWPHVRDRLTHERRGEKWELVVLDEQGKPTTATADALKEELRNRREFKPIVRGMDPVKVARHQREVAAATGQPTVH